MNIAERMICAIDDAKSNKLLSALQHACASLDGTGAKLYPKLGVRDRFIETFEQYIWIIEPMFAVGIDLKETIFKWNGLKKREPKFSEILYEIFRCNLAHGTELPTGYKLEFRKSEEYRTIEIGKDTLIIPDTIIFALLAVALFSKANFDQKMNKDYFLSCGTMIFTIDEWWGRETDVKICFSTVKLPKVKIEF